MSNQKASVTGRMMAATTPFLRIQEMMALFNMSRSTLYRRLAEDSTFPRPTQSPFGRSKRWRRDLVVEYLSNKMGFDASQLVSDCLKNVREQLREQGRWGTGKMA